MSIHRSKGLEWPTVFVIGVSEKILPHGKAHDDTEERRLFYVACTRARDTLAISSIAAAAYGANVVDLAPSRFLAEAGLVADEPAPGSGEHEIVVASEPNAPEV
jgi:superfamily I DNA/RNA helicase